MNFEAVLAGLPDAVIAVDTELRVVFWNSAAEVLAERSARRAEGRLLKEIFPAGASIVRRLAETLASGEGRSEAEALASAGRMAVGLAHEIRNPLGAIRGAVQLLARELASEPRLTEYTTVLTKEVDRVNRIIEMLLDLARPAPVRPLPLNLHQLHRPHQ